MSKGHSVDGSNGMAKDVKEGGGKEDPLRHFNLLGRGEYRETTVTASSGELLATFRDP
jgi:hypothetical protein